MRAAMLAIVAILLGCSKPDAPHPIAAARRPHVTYAHAVDDRVAGCEALKRLGCTEAVSMSFCRTRLAVEPDVAACVRIAKTRAAARACGENREGEPSVDCPGNDE